MRNTLIASLILSACGTSALAGAMGPVSSHVLPIFTPFISGEAAYSWPQIGGLQVNVPNMANVSSVNEDHGWGGRLAVGILHAMTERFAFSGEMGWGYYGNTNVEPRFGVSGVQVIPSQDTLSMSLDQYGFDVLAGMLYLQPRYDLFFKAGALFENMQLRTSVQPAVLLTGSSYAGQFVQNGVNSTFKFNMGLPQVMPEIKLGGAYHVTDNWSVNAAWMHAFGGNLSVSAPSLNFATPSYSNLTIELHNPSLNTIMFGLEYRFA